MWFKDDPMLSTVALAPATPIPAGGGAVQQRIAATYNRIGGLMSAPAAKAEPAAVRTTGARTTRQNRRRTQRTALSGPSSRFFRIASAVHLQLEDARS